MGLTHWEENDEQAAFSVNSRKKASGHETPHRGPNLKTPREPVPDAVAPPRQARGRPRRTRRRHRQTAVVRPRRGPPRSETTTIRGRPMSPRWRLASWARVHTFPRASKNGPGDPEPRRGPRSTVADHGRPSDSAPQNKGIGNGAHDRPAPGLGIRHLETRI